jgi:carbamate kinase
LAGKFAWTFKEDPRGRGWRRVVASPKPREIYNKAIMQALAEAGNLVIAAGGGGIPVIKKNSWFYGVEAVIDKDLSAAMLANTINASSLFILTDIQKVAINFKKPGEKFIDAMTVAEAESYYSDGHFEAGSMGPKVLAAIEFIRGGGEQCIITDARALDSISNGTIITK